MMEVPSARAPPCTAPTAHSSPSPPLALRPDAPRERRPTPSRPNTYRAASHPRLRPPRLPGLLLPVSGWRLHTEVSGHGLAAVESEDTGVWGPRRGSEGAGARGDPWADGERTRVSGVRR